jgi:hypothetical protein
MLGRAVNLYFITKYKNISTRKPKYRRAVMRIKEFILYGLTLCLQTFWKGVVFAVVIHPTPEL